MYQLLLCCFQNSQWLDAVLEKLPFHGKSPYKLWSLGYGLCIYYHVTMTLHRLTSVQNNMADVNDLFFFGDDFDAVLDILEIDEELEKQLMKYVYESF